MKLTVIGLGLIGGSIAKDLRHHSFVSRIMGVDLDNHHAEQAKTLGLVDGLETMGKSIEQADIIVLSTPVNAIAQLLPVILTEMAPSSVVVDMGSTKQLICQSVEKHSRRLHFVASHPMAGTENSGPEAACLNLFNGKPVVICEHEKSGAREFGVIKEMFGVLGMRLIFMSPEEHDLHAAYVSHLSHISSFVLANTVLDIEKNNSAIFDLASGGFESTVRLAKSSPKMWAPIFEQNKKHISDALSAYISHLQAFKKTIDDGHFANAAKLMEQANEIRRVLLNMARK